MLEASQRIIDLPTALTLGLVFGMGPCLLCCMPFLGPVFLSRGGGIRQSWRILLPLASGRLVAYAGLGFLCGLAGRQGGELVGRGTIFIVLGVASLLLGFALVADRWSALRCGSVQSCGTGSAGRTAGLMPGGLFLMGIHMALTPCAPLAAVLLSAAATGTATQGSVLGIAFGLGAIAMPSLFYGLGLAYLGDRLRGQLGLWRSRLNLLSAALLTLVGLSNLTRGVLLVSFSAPN